MSTAVEDVCETSSSDGEAPDDVSFSKSKTEAIDNITAALKQVKRTKQKGKEKRREFQELLKIQKEQKRIKLDNARLPDEILKEVAQEETEETSMGLHLRFVEDVPKAQGRSPKKVNRGRLTSGMSVESLESSAQVPSAKQVNLSAALFINKQLYGSRIPRDSVSSSRAKSIKRSGRPAPQFTIGYKPAPRKRKTPNKKMLAEN